MKESFIPGYNVCIKSKIDEFVCPITVSGEDMRGVIKLSISPSLPESIVEAKLTIEAPMLDLEVSSYRLYSFYSQQLDKLINQVVAEAYPKGILKVVSTGYTGRDCSIKLEGKSFKNVRTIEFSTLSQADHRLRADVVLVYSEAEAISLLKKPYCSEKILNSIFE